MVDMMARRCSRCGRERPRASFTSGASGPTDLCPNCRGFDHAANNTFGLRGPEVVEVDGGWRDARVLDGIFMGWLCPHVHATPQDAESCPDKESVLQSPPAH
jgi:hypothetical protein